MPEVGFKRFAPQGEAPVLSPLLIWGPVGSCARSGVSGRIVSQPLSPASMWACSCIGLAEPVFSFFFFFFRESFVPYVTVDLECSWEEVSSGPLPSPS